MEKRYQILAGVTALVLILDQATKVFIDQAMPLHSTITVIRNFFNISYVRNKGAAFGILVDSAYRLPFFIFVSIVAVLVICVAIQKLRPDQKLAAASLALIFSGALGNLIDRIRL